MSSSTRGFGAVAIPSCSGKHSIRNHSFVMSNLSAYIERLENGSKSGDGEPRPNPLDHCLRFQPRKQYPRTTDKS